MGRPVGSDRFYHGWSDVLLCILPIKARSSIHIRLGFSGSCIITCIRLVNDIGPDNSLFDGIHFIKRSNRTTRVCLGSVADCERIQSICNRFRDRKNNDERASARVIDLLIRGGLKTLPRPLPLSYLFRSPVKSGPSGRCCL